MNQSPFSQSGETEGLPTGNPTPSASNAGPSPLPPSGHFSAEWNSTAPAAGASPSPASAGETPPPTVPVTPLYGGASFPPPPAPTPAPAEAAKQPKYASRGSVIAVAAISLALSLLLGLTGLFAGLAIAGSDTLVPPTGKGEITINHVSSDYTAEINTDGTVASIVTKVAPAVVEIYTDTVTYSQYFGQQIQSGAGSGVILTKDGYIVTCAHVIDAADKITVRLKDGTELEASLIGADTQTDIAVIKVKPKNDLPFVAFGSSDALVVGQPVVAIGNPLGSLGGTVTTGIISAKDREIEIEGQLYNLLQTNAAINSGNSGGGLFDMNGNLIGIVNAKSGGDSIEGLGFAIPSAKAEEIATQLMAHGYVTGRPVIGINVLNVNSNEVIMQNLQYSRFFTQFGLYIIESEHNTLQLGDRLVAIDGDEIASMSDLQKILQGKKVGDTVDITVARIDGNRTKLYTTQITLREKTAAD